MGKHVISTKTPHRLSSSQEDVLHLWPLVTLCKSKHGSVRVVQKTSSEALIVHQRLRNHCTSKKNNAARQRERAEMKQTSGLFQVKRTECSYGLRTSACLPNMNNDVQYDNDVTCKDFD
ncbi:uncharacterized protein LOC123502949 [Portunus trituberculatus]|uniref:Uncharacterized protein n=1 Tax=Portunus trituberculatus TaxID=210409 RepID=A0A5B7IJU5_PORTR|nr:uncharacterized protein LOC123502949 [Portunus trituberculatus]MPC82573.1 hypothetical protein [Portunus trituberculatus]